MKRYNNLYDQIISIENLQCAEVIASQGKSGQYGVKVFKKKSEKNIFELHELLKAEKFVTSEYKIFEIREPKLRVVASLPFYPDRIVQHAIMNILEPIFLVMFTTDTYSSIKGKGIHAAAHNLKEALADKYGTEFCLKLDIQKFYPSVDHKILKELLRRKFKDQRLLKLLDGIINSAPGLPIGNLLSQFFANFYLTGFDHWVKQDLKVKNYFRYCDDVVILSDNKEYLHELFIHIRKYLSEKLNLTVKSNHRVFPVKCGIDFLGYVFFSHVYILLRKSIKQRFARQVKKGAARNILASYWGWAKHCNSNHLLKKLGMTEFKELAIKAAPKGFEGEKLPMTKILNRQIKVTGYSINPSKFPNEGNGKCLTLQIEWDGKKHVLFNASSYLMDMVEQVPKDKFPFMTTIVEENKRYEFT